MVNTFDKDDPRYTLYNELVTFAEKLSEYSNEDTYDIESECSSCGSDNAVEVETLDINYTEQELDREISLTVGRIKHLLR